MPAYPQITFAELIAVQAVHRYDAVRAKLGLHPTDKLLYKLFVSVPEDRKDPASELLDWWTRRTLKQNCGMVCDDSEQVLDTFLPTLSSIVLVSCLKVVFTFHL